MVVRGDQKQIQCFWSLGRSEGLGPVDQTLAKIEKKKSRFKRKCHTFRPPLASFVDQTKEFKMWWPSGVVGGKQERKKEEGRERKTRDKVKEVWFFAFALVLAEGNHQENTKYSTFFKVILWDFFSKNFSFMCWNINYVNSLIYFMKKVEAFVCLRFVFIPVLEHRFYTEIFLMSLRVLW